MWTRARTATALAVAIALAACAPNSTPSVPDGWQTTTPSPRPTVQPDAQLRQATRMTLDAPSKRITGSAAVGGHDVTFDVTFVGKDAKGTKISSAPGISTTVEFVRLGKDLATVVVTFSEFGTASGTIAAPTGEIFDPERDFPDIAVGHD